MAQSTVCPWCQTEIVGELGHEKVCPFCENELGDYRTLDVELDQDEDENGKSEVAEQAECAFCHETTVKVGVQKVDHDHFVPTVWPDHDQALLQPPFTMDVYLCVACSQLQFILSDESRKQLEQRVSEIESQDDRIN